MSFSHPFFISCQVVWVSSDASMLVGTGKSLLLRAIIMALKKKHASKPEVVSVTASTGMAASNIGGAFRQSEPWIHFLIIQW